MIKLCISILNFIFVKKKGLENIYLFLKRDCINFFLKKQKTKKKQRTKEKQQNEQT